MKQTLEQAAEDFVWEVMENDEDGISEQDKRRNKSIRTSTQRAMRHPESHSQHRRTNPKGKSYG